MEDRHHIYFRKSNQVSWPNVSPLTCSRRPYYIFSGPPCENIFSKNSEKISSHYKFLSMKRCADNQINASFIDISRIKWLVFLLRSSFFRTTTCTLPLQAPKHRPIIGPHLVEETAFRRDMKDNGYKSIFTNLWLGRQQNRSWIRD